MSTVEILMGHLSWLSYFVGENRLKAKGTGAIRGRDQEFYFYTLQ